MWRVPKCFTDIVSLSLTDHTTSLKFDNYISNPILLDNGTMQGDPLSMNYTTSYNAPLIKTAIGNNELSPAFVDDSMVLAIGNTLAECHEYYGTP